MQFCVNRKEGWTNIDEPRLAIGKIEEIPSTLREKFVESMPRRLKAVIRAKGGPTTF